jgi:hypothetical protein
VEIVRWWIQSSRFDGFSGQPFGPPEWPRKGGLLNQTARLVDAVDLLRAEWPHVVKHTKGPSPEKGVG